MAVEARHLNIFPSRILSNRESMMNSLENGNNMLAAPMVGYGVVRPFSATTTTGTTTQGMVPMFRSAVNDITPAKAAAMKSDSGLTYSVPVSRKRSRDVINPLVLSSLTSVGQNQAAKNRRGYFSFLGEDISYQIQQQQLEIDCFIAQHTENVRIEIEQKRKRFAQKIAAAMEETIMKKLKSKEEEIQKIGKLNWALEERAKSLCVENQLWRDLAQNNEATANALRSNLEQVLDQLQENQQRPRGGDEAVTDDAQSCCGSNFEEADRRTIAGGGYGGCSVAGTTSTSNGKSGNCRSCGKEESRVLLLPCRHLCLCTVCGSSVHTCPVCNSTKTGSVHVNLSS